MESIKPFLDTVLILVSIGLLCALGAMIIGLHKYYQLKQQSLRNDIEYRQLENENKNKTVDYSNKVLELVRSIIGQIAVIKFRNFQDSHDMSKVTEANVKSLVKDVATMAMGSLNMKNIFLEDTFFTKDFIEQYIIDTTVILIKQMMEKAVNDMENT